MKYLNKITLFILIVFIAIACKKEEEEPNPPTEYDTATLRAKNFITDDGSFDFLIDDMVAVQGLNYAFGGVSEFEWVKGETSVKFSINQSANSNEIFSDDLDVVADGSYLAALVGPLSGGQVIITTNDTQLPSATDVKLRFLHAYQDIGAVDVFIGGSEESNKLVSNLEFAKLSAYIVTSEENLTASIIVTPTGVAPNMDTNLYNSFDNASHDGGNIYFDVFASQTTDPTSKFSLFIMPQ